MSAELVRDLERDSGWWLLVDGSEQSFVDVDDPTHLEFEYVQMAAYVIDSFLDCWSDEGPVDALHFGGGLLTIPRWLAHRRPGSRQLVAERSREIAAMADSLGTVPDVEVRIADATAVLDTTTADSVDLVVCDVYDGPQTVTSLFTLGALATIRDRLRHDGLYVCNLSDASPFALTKAVAATVRTTFDQVVMLVEPPVLRGRRSGNVILAGSRVGFPIPALSRRAAGGPLRARVLVGEDLATFVGSALPAGGEGELPASGESLGRRYSWR